MRLIGLAVALLASVAFSLFASLVDSAGAGDDSELRRMVREAGLVPYWSFKVVKDFSYPEVDAARPVSVRELRGKVLLVNLWATWCPPCVREMPSLQRLHEQFDSQGLTVLGINASDRTDLPGIKSWLLKRNLTFLNLKGDKNGPPLVSNFYTRQTFILDHGRFGPGVSGNPAKRFRPGIVSPAWSCRLPGGRRAGRV
jgi:thiol-disulfide isomerase/thioredoxin